MKRIETLRQQFATMQEEQQRVETWHNERFNEIVSSPSLGKQWLLSIPRRYGNTHICERLASYFVKQGRPVYWQGKRPGPNGTKYCPRWVNVQGDYVPLNPRCVLIVDRPYEWDAHQAVICAGGTVIVAYPGCKNNPKREYNEWRELTP